MHDPLGSRCATESAVPGRILAPLKTRTCVDAVVVSRNHQQLTLFVFLAAKKQCVLVPWTMSAPLTVPFLLAPHNEELMRNSEAGFTSAQCAPFLFLLRPFTPEEQYTSLRYIINSRDAILVNRSKAFQSSTHSGWAPLICHLQGGHARDKEPRCVRHPLLAARSFLKPLHYS